MATGPADRYLSASVRESLEQAYYARVNEQARLENLAPDPEFWAATSKHPALFSDHGVIHVRDVARRMLRVLETINGVLIPARSPLELEAFMFGYGVALAYLHDIGMSRLSAFGRFMHPEFAAQSVFDGSLDAVVAAIWDDNCGNIAWRLTKLTGAGVIRRDP